MRWLLCLILIGLAMPNAARAEPPVELPCRLCGAVDEPGAGPKPRPMALELATTLDFDRVILTGAAGGYARLGPDGSRASSGAIATLSGRAALGEVVVRGEPGRAIRVDLPVRVDLHGFGGGTLAITRLTSDLPSFPRLDAEGRLRFRFGGELFVSGDAEGNYRGDVPITVEYL